MYWTIRIIILIYVVLYIYTSIDVEIFFFLFENNRFVLIFELDVSVWSE